MTRRTMQARKQYWENIDAALFRRVWTRGGWTRMSRRPKGSEDNLLVDHKLALGSGARYANVYSAVSCGRRERGAAGGIGQEARVYFVAVGVCGYRRDTA